MPQVQILSSRLQIVSPEATRDPIHNQRSAFGLRIDRLDERLTQRLDRISENVEAITVQIGSFTEGPARLEHSLERLEQRIDHIAAVSEHQAETARVQAVKHPAANGYR